MVVWQCVSAHSLETRVSFPAPLATFIQREGTEALHNTYSHGMPHPPGKLSPKAPSVLAGDGMKRRVPTQEQMHKKDKKFWKVQNQRITD